jgi:hypothetical protein
VEHNPTDRRLNVTDQPKEIRVGGDLWQHQPGGDGWEACWYCDDLTEAYEAGDPVFEALEALWQATR